MFINGSSRKSAKQLYLSWSSPLSPLLSGSFSHLLTSNKMHQFLTVSKYCIQKQSKLFKFLLQLYLIQNWDQQCLPHISINYERANLVEFARDILALQQELTVENQMEAIAPVLQIMPIVEVVADCRRSSSSLLSPISKDNHIHSLLR